MNGTIKRKFGGLGISLVSTGFIIYNWRTAILEGYFYTKISLFFPMFLVIGIALVLYPGYKEERILRGEDISTLKGLELITTRWWIILGVSLLVGGINYYLLMSL